MVMDYFELDLSVFINNSESFDICEQHILIIMYNLLCAINHLHSCNIMHRDLKPANIMMTTECIPVVADFGLARTCLKQTKKMDPETTARKNKFEDDSNKAPKRKLSNHVQSRWYRAPEVILLQQDYDTKVDMWSIGCILGELLGCLQNTIS